MVIVIGERIKIYHSHFRDAEKLLSDIMKGNQIKTGHVHEESNDGGYILIDPQMKEVIDRQSCFPINLRGWSVIR